MERSEMEEGESNDIEAAKPPVVAYEDDGRSEGEVSASHFVLHSDYTNISEVQPRDEPIVQEFQGLCVADGSERFERRSPPPPKSPEPSHRKPLGTCTGSTSSAPGTPAAFLSRISTPMQGNSPSTSQVSVNSVPPNMVACLMSDLTPVTRNTSAAVMQQYVSNKSSLVSPEETLLLGEDLVLPSREDWYPKIRRSGGFPNSSVRARSHDEDATAAMLSHHPLPPVPMERKFYSFTSREQYEETASAVVVEDTPLIHPPPRLAPYQPSRELLGDLGLQEDLNDIFIARRRPASSSPLGGGDGAVGAAEAVEASKEHRLLHLPIPMDERQASIPSIRLANHLNGSHSVTSREDDEDSLYIHDEEGSLSSRGSTCGVYFDECPVDTAAAARLLIERRKRGRKEEALEWLQSVVEVSDNTLAEAASSKFLTRQDNRGDQPSAGDGIPSTVPFQRLDSLPPGYLASYPY